MLYKNKPKDFNPRFEVVGCFCECKGKILLLHRQGGKSEGNKWGVPTGKMEKGEKPEDAMQREIKEETSLFIQKSRIKYFGKYYVRYPDYGFIYYVFHTILEKPEVRIEEKEHKNFLWVTPKDALKMNLVIDEDECIKLFYRI